MTLKLKLLIVVIAIIVGYSCQQKLQNTKVENEVRRIELPGVKEDSALIQLSKQIVVTKSLGRMPGKAQQEYEINGELELLMLKHGDTLELEVLNVGYDLHMVVETLLFNTRNDSVLSRSQMVLSDLRKKKEVQTALDRLKRMIGFKFKASYRNDSVTWLSLDIPLADLDTKMAYNPAKELPLIMDSAYLESVIRYGLMGPAGSFIPDSTYIVDGKRLTVSNHGTGLVKVMVTREFPNEKKLITTKQITNTEGRIKYCQMDETVRTEQIIKSRTFTTTIHRKKVTSTEIQLKRLLY